jgi:hypothetical protein
MKRLLALLAAAICVAPAQLLADAPNDTSPMAVNIDQLNYYSPEWILVDAFKKAGGWSTRCVRDCPAPPPTCPAGWNAETQERHLLDLDTDGWVRSLPAADSPACYRGVATFVFRGNNRQRPNGQYVVLYEGQGTYTYLGNPQVVSQSPGRDVLNVSDGSELVIFITATTPGNYLRNFRVILPGGICDGNQFDYGVDEGACTSQGKTYTSFEANHATQIFHPVFMEGLRKYRAIRYMQFQRTNDNINTLSRWNQVPPVSYAFWSNPATTPPWELSFRLSNRLSADAWINIPTRADDDFVRQAAQQAYGTLSPPLKVYVEYGNEIWNNAWPYAQAGLWVQQQGQARWGIGNDTPLTRAILRHSWFGMRSQQICDIWKQEWGAQADRVVCVMGGFIAAPIINQTQLECPYWVNDPQNTTRTNCARGMHALAVAPYFAGHIAQPRFLPTVLGWMQEPDGGLGSLFAEIANVGIPEMAGHVRRNAALATRFNLDLVAYEGGADVITGAAPNDPAMDLRLRANRDPRMGEMYDLFMRMWRTEGGKLNTIYNNVSPATSFGALGTREYQTQPRAEAPKFDAIMNFIETTPCWWSGCAAP